MNLAKVKFGKTETRAVFVMGLACPMTTQIGMDVFHAQTSKQLHIVATVNPRSLQNDQRHKDKQANKREGECAMNSLIEVFRMEEISKSTRAKIIIKLGRLINDQYGSNVTEPLVLELVRILDPSNKITTNPHYLLYAEEISLSEYKEKL